MSEIRLILILSLCTFSIVDGVLAFYAYRMRDRNGAREFMALAAALGIYTAGYAFEIAGNTLPWVLFWLKIEYIGISFIPFFWMALAWRYTGHEGWLKQVWSIVLLGFSIATLLIHWTNGYHHLFYVKVSLEAGGHFPTAHFVRGPWYWVGVAYVYITVLNGNLLFLTMRQRTAPIYRGQVDTMLWASLLPWIGSIIYYKGLSPWGLDLLAFNLTASTLIYAWGLFKYKLFDLTPIARAAIVETMEDGVIALDPQNRIVDYNPAAARILADLHPAVIGQSAAQLPFYPILKDQIDRGVERQEFRTAAAAGERHIESRLTPFSQKSGKASGRMLVLHDITQQKLLQEQLIQTEKMAVLGQLVANVAHELNTPLAAIKATAENVEQTFEHLWQQLAELHPRLQKDPGYREIWERIQDTPHLTTREERDELRQLAPLLEDQGWEPSSALIRNVVKLGIAEDFRRLAPSLREPRHALALGFILEMALARKNLRTIREAAEKTTKIRYALKNYHHAPGPEPLELTDVRAGLESVLQLYESLLKKGIHIAIDFKPVPPILAHADELRQVWTNLIHNAIQAMDGKGELVITLEQQGEEMMAAFRDNGPGIAADVLPHIFDPFFTTKAAGEGSGLGLNICRQIVERHLGRIELHSEPGRTEFRVFLPIQQRAEAGQNEFAKG